MIGDFEVIEAHAPRLPYDIESKRTFFRSAPRPHFEPIAKAQQAKVENAISAVLPAFATLQDQEIDGRTCHLAYADDGTFVGAAVEAGNDKGFGGHLQLMVGLDAEGNVSGYQILETHETPGLGAKADQWFQKGQKGCIVGLNPANGLTVSKDGGQVDAITASTITSRAFLLAVTNAYNAYKGNSTDAATGASQIKKEE